MNVSVLFRMFLEIDMPAATGAGTNVALSWCEERFAESRQFAALSPSRVIAACRLALAWLAALAVSRRPPRAKSPETGEPSMANRSHLPGSKPEDLPVSQPNEDSSRASDEDAEGDGSFVQVTLKAASERGDGLDGLEVTASLSQGDDNRVDAGERVIKHALKRMRRGAQARCEMIGDRTRESLDCCASSIRLSGDFAQVKKARKTLKKLGFLNTSKDVRYPLNGHWETEHGLRIVVEGKIVRWTQIRASRLQFIGSDRCSCSLSLYGEKVTGNLVTSNPGGPATLEWSNGDVWRLLNACSVGELEMVSHATTQVVRDSTQDAEIRAATRANLRLANKVGLCLQPDCLDQVMQFIGSTTYCAEVRFDGAIGPQHMGAKTGFHLLDSLSQRHPLVGFRCHLES